DSGGAAAPVRLGQLDDAKSGNLGQKLARLALDLLAVSHVAGIVIRARERNGRERPAQLLLREELGEITNGGGEPPGALGVRAIVGEQMTVGLHVRAAARR